MKQPPYIAPSLLAADPGAYSEEIRSVQSAGADWLHVDVMDGSFVPAITFGDNIVAMAKKCSTLFLDVHLMIVRPELHISSFAKAGAQRIIVHQETSPHLLRTLNEIKSLGLSSGVALNPATNISTVVDVLGVVDLVLIMTVNPGWGGQEFIQHSLKKIEGMREEIQRQGSSAIIEVDGGINSHTAPLCVNAGASALVAGSAVFGAHDRAAAIAALRGNAAPLNNS